MSTGMKIGVWSSTCGDLSHITQDFRLVMALAQIVTQILSDENNCVHYLEHLGFSEMFMIICDL